MFCQSFIKVMMMIMMMIMMMMMMLCMSYFIAAWKYTRRAYVDYVKT